MTNTRLATAALALAGSLAAGAAQAHGGNDLRWSISVAGPIGLALHGGHPAAHHRHGHYAPPVVYGVPRPIFYVAPGHHGKHRGWRHGPHWDRDGDGIPNRYDRHYNPRGDRDHDGIPNWRDRRDRPGR